MAIFYTDSGSFSDVDINGSLRVTGSLFLTGSTLVGTSSFAATASYVEYANVANKPTLVSSSAQINTGSFTGSFTGTLIGTSSWATTSSVVISASYATTSSYVSGYIDLPNGLEITGSLVVTGSQTTIGNTVITGSLTISSSTATELLVVGNSIMSGGLNVTQGITGSLFGTSSWSSTASVSISSSYSLTASYALNGGGGGGNAFGVISVAGQSDVVADSASDTVTLVAGSNITITTDATTDSITINSTGGGGSAFPYTGSAIISGSLNLTGSAYIEGNGASNTLLYGTNTLDDYTQIIAQNLSNGANASTDLVLAADNATDFQEFIDLGINSTGFVGLIGNANDGYLYMTSSAGELVIGNATTNAKGNVRLFTGGGDTNNVTRIFISSSGQIGIGTTTLTDTLTISGSTDFTGSIIVTGTVTASGYRGDGSQLTNMIGKSIAYSTFQYFL